jgi:hypothetical protein
MIVESLDTRSLLNHCYAILIKLLLWQPCLHIYTSKPRVNIYRGRVFYTSFFFSHLRVRCP